MKKINLFVFAMLALSLVSCRKDKGTITVTYQEATAIYGNIEEVRNQALNEVAREIENAGKIYVASDFILIGEEEAGIHVVDNSDPTNPTPSHFINIPGNREFFVEGDFLFAESYYDMIKIDISNPFDAHFVARAENIFQDILFDNEGKALLGFSFEEVTKEVDHNSNLYQEISGNDFVYYDYARNIIPKSAVPSSFAGNSNGQSGTVNRITHAKDHVYIIGNEKMAIIDDANGFETVQGFDPNSPIGWRMETIFPHGDNLFIGSRASMDIYSISNPASPSQLFSFSHATSCDPVLPVGDVAYVTLRTGDFSECPGDINALLALDIGNLQNPTQTAEVEMTSPYGMSKINTTLFVGEGANGLSIFDISNPEKPELIKIDNSVTAYDVIEHPTRTDLILIAGPNGLNQYNIDTDLNLDLQGTIVY